MGDIFERYLDGLQQTEIEASRGVNYKREYEGNELKDLQAILNLIARYDPHIKNFMGWPGITKDLQEKLAGRFAAADITWTLSHKKGYTMHSHILGHDLEDRMNRDLTISVEDDHPREEGHKAIADFIIQDLKL